MPLQANISTESYDKNDEEIMATYWVVFDIAINFESQNANCCALGYIKEKHYTENRKIVATRMFYWGGSTFAFKKGENIVAQMQAAIIAYDKIDPISKEVIPGEFAKAIVVDGSRE